MMMPTAGLHPATRRAAFLETLLRIVIGIPDLAKRRSIGSKSPKESGI